MFKRLTLITLIITLIFSTPVYALSYDSQYGDGLKAYDEAVLNMPKLVSVVIDDGYSAEITDMDLFSIFKGHEGATFICGVTDYDNKKIYVSVCQTPDRVAWTAYHEWGHAVTNVFRLKNVAEGLYAEELPMLFNYFLNVTDDPTQKEFAQYCTLSSDEFLSEAFALYMTKPDTLKVICPKTYMTFEAMMKQIAER